MLFDSGRPSCRKRVLSCGLNNGRMICPGPESDDALQKDSDLFFERTMSLTGQMYCQAPDVEVNDQFKEWAGLRKCHDGMDLADPM